MEPCSFAVSFPFVPPDVLCRIHDVLFLAKPAPIAEISSASAFPPGEEVAPALSALDSQGLYTGGANVR